MREKIEVELGQIQKTYYVDVTAELGNELSFTAVWTKNAVNDFDGWHIYNKDGDELLEERDEEICNAVVSAIEKWERKNEQKTA